MTDGLGHRRRLVPALAVALIHAGFGVLVLLGGGWARPALETALETSVVFITEATEPPRPTPPAAPARRPRPPARPALTAEPVEIVVPPPVIDLAIPTLIVAAPIAALGDEARAGASQVDGGGSGAGGSGDGLSGGGGSGSGGVHSRWLSGDIDASDYPRAAIEAGASGTVVAEVTVGVNGRVTDCTVVESSGNAALDETTCRLVTRRYRYEPGRDAAGRPVSDVWVEEQTWTLDER